MKDKEPSIQEWKDLYSVAIEFKKLKCWNFMWDSDIFGVQNPVTGKIGYCCIMGNEGEHFALGVFLGTEGLEGLFKLQSCQDMLSDTESIYSQRCIMVSFEDREYITKQDYEKIIKLELKFRGHNEWPLFRSYMPHHLPWYLTSEEAQFLTIALQQAIHVCKRFKNDPEMLIHPSTNEILVRIPLKDNSLEWKDEWLIPSEKDEKDIIIGNVDDDAIDNLIKLKHNGIWEADFFYFHEIVQENPEERPYYPYVLIWAEQDNGIILNNTVVNPEEWADSFSNQLQENVENTASLPHMIIVKKKELFTFLEPVTFKLGIKLTLASNLKLIDQIKKDMYDIPMDENKAFEELIELLIEDDSFQALLKDKTIQDLIEKRSFHGLMENKSIQSLIEKKQIEINNQLFKEKDPEQTTLF